jgi:hypothetical protein
MRIAGTARAIYDMFRRRKVNYQLAFTSPAGQEVMMDLAKFCRANDTCFNEDPRIHAVLEGRREVWLRIQKYLNLTPDQLYGLHAGHQFDPRADDKPSEEE